MPCWQEFASPEQLLVHGWGRIKNLNAYSLLALSTHKNVKCYPTMTKASCELPKTRIHPVLTQKSLKGSKGLELRNSMSLGQ